MSRVLGDDADVGRHVAGGLQSAAVVGQQTAEPTKLLQKAGRHARVAVPRPVVVSGVDKVADVGDRRAGDDQRREGDPEQVPDVLVAVDPLDHRAHPGRSEEHTLNSSHGSTSYAVFCLKKKKKTNTTQHIKKKQNTITNKLKKRK